MPVLDLDFIYRSDQVPDVDGLKQGVDAGHVFQVGRLTITQ